LEGGGKKASWGEKGNFKQVEKEINFGGDKPILRKVEKTLYENSFNNARGQSRVDKKMSEPETRGWKS